ncbi:MAG TPA: hypothetical protein PK760_08990, partial [Flavobacteriales bacterium]|nr:hypothetical protein [Flavobacteriales bacterium]
CALRSGGEVRVRAEANGQQVTVGADQVQIHFPAATMDPLMQRFVGEAAANGDVLWVADGALAMDTVGIALPDSAGGQWWLPGSYYSTPWPAQNAFNSTWPAFDFINCDHPLPPGGDSTDVVITVPPGFHNDGGTVWIVIPDLDCMVYMEGWDSGNSVRAGFPLRVGLQGTIVALSGSEGNYHSSFTPITITADHHQTISVQPTTIEQYHLDLQAL